ncbi:alpha/beta fold hydrolase [Symbioplanes lichenis]|uniref:alpha/beta fold hydrolase n=1 Tax=Symbioplanes lichenis TaxID=1629072 RepID=UPI002739AC18|nr:alpha/beta hydrolase [Actinoplanes lichenis]
MQATAIDEGLGFPLLVLHGGMGDPSSWHRVTDRLRPRFRTVRLHRRQYRMDLPRPVTMAEEVEHVAEVAGTLGRPPVLIGHSSGAVLALEAMAADPRGYAGAVLYEPPVVVKEPLGGAAQVAARAALDRGSPGRAISIFARDIVGAPAWQAVTLGWIIGHSRYRDRVVRQLDDNDAIDALGVRLPAYAELDLPVLLVGGDKSPAHLSDRLDALERALPRTTRLVMHGQGHNAEMRAPGRVAAAIERFVDSAISPPTTS